MSMERRMQEIPLKRRDQTRHERTWFLEEMREETKAVFNRGKDSVFNEAFELWASGKTWKIFLLACCETSAQLRHLNVRP